MRDPIELQAVATLEWRERGSLKLQVQILTNTRARYFCFLEFLPYSCSYSICVPEGYRSSCWTLFEKELLRSPGLLRRPPFFLRMEEPSSSIYQQRNPNKNIISSLRQPLLIRKNHGQIQQHHSNCSARTTKNMGVLPTSGLKQSYVIG